MQHKITIRLFKGVEIKSQLGEEDQEALVSTDKYTEITKRTIRLGFLFSPQVVHNYSPQELLAILEAVQIELALSPEKMNNTFFGSWDKVAHAPIIQLVYEQFIHYFTTYGFKDLGFYNQASIYVPTKSFPQRRLLQAIFLYPPLSLLLLTLSLVSIGRISAKR